MTLRAVTFALLGGIALLPMVSGGSEAATPRLPTVSPKDAVAKTATPKPVTKPVAKEPKAPASYSEQLVARAETLLAPGTSPDDHAAAARLLQEAVSAGNIDARVLLAGLYWRGDGVGQSSDKAEKLLLDAILGDTSGRASFALGEMYSTRDSYLFDPQKARIMYQNASDRGYAPGMIRLARILLADAPGEQAAAQAESLLLKARDLGEASTASEALGDFYAMKAEWRDFTKAMAAYEAAAALNNAAAQLKLAAALLEGTDVAADPARARKILEKTVEAPSSAAPTELWIRLGDLLVSPKADKAARDPKMAAAMYDKAAYEGDRDGMVRLARMLIAGEGIAEDQVRAKALLERAMEKGALAEGGLSLGDLLGKDGPLSDYHKAALAYQAAADAGNAAAMLKLAHFYSAGWGLTADKGMAVKYATLAMNAGLWAAASEELGDIYMHFGYEADHQAAIDAYGRAADAGRTTAMLKLAHILGDGSQPADAARARDLAMRAVAAGDPVGGWSMLADIYRNPATPLFDLAKAGETYGKAAELGDASSMLKLAGMLTDGKSLPVDIKRAVALYQAAISAGEVAAGSERLGDLYLASAPPFADRKKGVTLLEAAAAAGSGTAHLKLVRIQSAQPSANWAEIAKHVRQAAAIAGARVASVEVMNLSPKAAVAITQQLLRDAGFPAQVTGTFREATETSIKAFCTARKIEPCESTFVNIDLLTALVTPAAGTS